MTAGITVEQFRKLGGGRRRISKANIEKLERGEDPVPDEDTEGELVNERFLNLLLTDYEIDHTTKPGIMEYSHLPNETGVSSAKVQARKSKQGTRPGVPDYFAAIRNDVGEYAIVWIELKKERGKNGGMNWSRISDAQRRMIRILNMIPNVAAHFAHGHAEAISILESYIFTS